MPVCAGQQTRPLLLPSNLSERQEAPNLCPEGHGCQGAGINQAQECRARSVASSEHRVDEDLASNKADAQGIRAMMTVLPHYGYEDLPDVDGEANAVADEMVKALERR